MNLSRREGEFINVVKLDDLRSAVFNDAPMTTPNAMTDNTENSEFLDVIEPDEEFLNELRTQDLNYAIKRVFNKQLEVNWHSDDALPKDSRNRSYRNTPNVDAYAMDKQELDQLAAKSHGLNAEITSAVPVGLWHYEKCDTTCVFCYEQLMGPCHKCLSDETPASECKIAIGECGHPIHVDCQNAWSGKKNCMTCQQDWKVKTELSVYGQNLSI